MKKPVALFLFLMSLFAYSQVKWMTMGEAFAAQKENPKKIFVHFFAEWCGSCKLMDKKTFANVIIAEYINENYYPVKFNAEGNEKIVYFGKTFANPDYEERRNRNSLHQFTEFMNVSSVPSIIFLDEKSMPITMLNGFFFCKRA